MRPRIHIITYGLQFQEPLAGIATGFGAENLHTSSQPPIPIDQAVDLQSLKWCRFCGKLETGSSESGKHL